MLATVRPFASIGMFATTDKLAEIRRRAQAVIDRAYGPQAPTPHGFADPAGFVQASRTNNVRKRAHQLVVRRLVDRALRNGQLELAAVKLDGSVDFVRVPGDHALRSPVRRPRYCHEAARLNLRQQGSCGAVVGCCEHTKGGPYDR